MDLVAAVGLAAVVAMALIGFVGWLLIQRRRRRTVTAADSYAPWADAACPACLTLALVDR